uniref:Hemicentin-1-like von Willebrand factor A domain-containing protein n=1 Tax=Panagrolaimus davidi TaxID=227884 RepID=A0A914QLL8_9BILA
MFSRFLVFLFLGVATIQAISVKRVAKTKCPAGFTGELCDVPICNPPGHANFSSDGQSIAFFVHDSVTTIQMIQTMKSQMKTIIDQAVKQSPKWLIQFDLTIFDDLYIKSLGGTRSPDEFIQTFDEFAAGNSHNRSSCNDLPVLAAIYIYLYTTNLPKNANIYIFMNGIPRIDSNLFETVQDLIVATHAKVYFIQTNAYPCGQPLTNPGSSLMWDIASISGGQVFVIAAKNTDEVMKIIPFHYKSSIIAQQSFADCSEGQSITFPIDSQTKILNVLINGELANDSPKYFMPDGKLLRYVDNIFTDYSANTRADEFNCDTDFGIVEQFLFKIS